MASSQAATSYGPTVDQVITWLQGLDEASKTPVFQVIDTLVQHRDRNGNIPPLEGFNFPARVAPASAFIRRFLQSVPPRSLLTELQNLAHLRPQEAPIIPAPALPAPPTTNLGAQPSKDDIREALTDRDHVYKGLLTSSEHALEVKEQYMSLNDKKGRTNVPAATDFPADFAGQSELVRRLFVAMTDIESAIDDTRQKRKSNKRKAGELEDEEEEPQEDAGIADSTHVARIKNAANLEIEIACWDTLIAAKEAQDGIVHAGSWRGVTWHYDKFPTFMERFEKIEYAFRHSKGAVHGVMTSDFARRLAAAPNQEYKRKIQNKDLNRTRNVQVKAGIAALNNTQVRVNEDLSLVDAVSGETIAPPQPGSAQLNKECERLQRERAANKPQQSAVERAARLPATSAPTQGPSGSTTRRGPRRATRPAPASASAPAPAPASRPSSRRAPAPAAPALSAVPALDSQRGPSAAPSTPGEFSPVTPADVGSGRGNQALPYLPPVPGFNLAHYTSRNSGIAVAYEGIGDFTAADIRPQGLGPITIDPAVLNVGPMSGPSTVFAPAILLGSPMPSPSTAFENLDVEEQLGVQAGGGQIELGDAGSFVTTFSQEEAAATSEAELQDPAAAPAADAFALQPLPQDFLTYGDGSLGEMFLGGDMGLNEPLFGQDEYSWLKDLTQD